MRMTTRLAALSAMGALALTGCGDDSDGASGDGSSRDVVTIVASTNVYGDIAGTIAGDHADVTSLITSASQDPHEYEATTQDRVALDKADIVIENGAGYDHFVDTLMSDSDNEPTVLNAVEISGLLPAGADASGEEEIEGFNEHVWYNFAAVQKLAEALERELAEQDRANADDYESNLDSFLADLGALQDRAQQTSATTAGEQVAITEPVPLYLLEACGLKNATPAEFSEAVEEGGDVPPRVLQETLDLVGSGDVVLLAYNDQTTDATTEQVRSAAESAGVPVVSFTETLPDDKSYIAWMQDNLDHVADALG